jgi:protein ImuB
LICCLVVDSPPPKPGALAEIARACSPRVEVHGERVVVFDASGLDRIIGPPALIAREVSALAIEQGLIVRIAMAPTMVAAWLMAHAQIGQTVVEPPRMTAMLGLLPIQILSTLPEYARPRKASSKTSSPLLTFDRWGLKTLSQVARLPRADVHARLGDEGVRLHQAACGEDPSPLVPGDPESKFFERQILEWPIEGLEPLTFVLSRLCDALSLSLERADRGAIAITTLLKLVDRTRHERTLNLPAPMRDARTLRTLIVLDLESHPPAAGIDEVGIEAGVAPGRIVQGSLLDRALPTPETIATLTARLGALAGESRVGAPTLVDTNDDRQIAQKGFTGTTGRAGPKTTPGTTGTATSPTVLRRFRIPIPARVVVERGGPVRVMSTSSAIPSGVIVNRAGPWRTSGRWWTTDRTKWDRDEWDVELAGGGCYRLARLRDTGSWEIEGEID